MHALMRYMCVRIRNIHYKFGRISLAATSEVINWQMSNKSASRIEVYGIA